MTKQEVRSVLMSTLAIEDGDKVLEIGGGTGSVTVAMADQGAQVMSIERKSEGVDLMWQNCQQLLTDEAMARVTLVQGMAPQDLPEDVTFDKVFIGGSGGNMADICNYIDAHLVEGGYLVATSVTLDTPVLLLDHMEQCGYTDIECVNVQISRMKKIGNSRMMQAENPVQVIFGKKGRA